MSSPEDHQERCTSCKKVKENEFQEVHENRNKKRFCSFFEQKAFLFLRLLYRRQKKGSTKWRDGQWEESKHRDGSKWCHSLLDDQRLLLLLEVVIRIHVESEVREWTQRGWIDVSSGERDVSKKWTHKMRTKGTTNMELKRKSVSSFPNAITRQRIRFWTLWPLRWVQTLRLVAVQENKRLMDTMSMTMSWIILNCMESSLNRKYDWKCFHWKCVDTKFNFGKRVQILKFLPSKGVTLEIVNRKCTSRYIFKSGWKVFPFSMCWVCINPYFVAEIAGDKLSGSAMNKQMEKGSSPRNTFYDSLCVHIK